MIPNEKKERRYYLAVENKRSTLLRGIRFRTENKLKSQLKVYKNKEL